MLLLLLLLLLFNLRSNQELPSAPLSDLVIQCWCALLCFAWSSSKSILLFFHNMMAVPKDSYANASAGNGNAAIVDIPAIAEQGGGGAAGAEMEMVVIHMDEMPNERNGAVDGENRDSKVSPLHPDSKAPPSSASASASFDSKVSKALSNLDSSAASPTTSPSNSPSPASGPPMAVVPPFFSAAFFLQYFSKFVGQHGPAVTIAGIRKPLHLFVTFIGALLGIGFLAFLNYNIFTEIDYQSNGIFLIGSFGASAALLYGAPMSDFSQPRNVWGGHVVSALVGLIVGAIIPTSDTNYETLRAAFAVALAIVAMNVTHTVHPPGGATALIAVSPNAAIQNLHWLYLVLPVAVGAAIMILVAILVNNCTSTRHYPKYWI